MAAGGWRVLQAKFTWSDNVRAALRLFLLQLLPHIVLFLTAGWKRNM
jgi:hypothetical protein